MGILTLSPRPGLLLAAHGRLPLDLLKSVLSLTAHPIIEQLLFSKLQQSHFSVSK